MDKVLLVSGGIDSFLNYTLFNNDAFCLFIDTKGRYINHDLKAAESLFPRMHVTRNVVSLHKYETPDGIIAHRNTMLATVAAQYGNRVLFSCPSEDIYADTRPRFFKQLSKLLSISGDSRVVVENSLIGYTKIDLIQEYLAIDGNIDTLLKTRSCYSGEHKGQCGACSACVKRFIAMESNGIHEHYTLDPRTYARKLMSKGSLRDVLRLGPSYMLAARKVLL